MKLGDKMDSTEKAEVVAHLRSALAEDMIIERAHGRFVHRRPKNWVVDKKTGLLVPDVKLIPHKLVGPAVMVPDPDCYDLLSEDESWNVKTNVGIVFTHTQTYGSSPGANGLNYIALSNDTLTETATSTTLSTEITTNGLGRVQGTIVLPTGSGTVTTVDKTFTATGSQSAQKAALFTAISAGTMNHALAFTQRSLISGDTLEITFSLTIS
jgi:hypothetical protein